jgi:hypothetical protein
MSFKLIKGGKGKTSEREREAVEKEIRAAELPGPIDGTTDAEGVKLATAKKETIADKLLSIADERLTLGKSESGDLFAVDIEGPNVALSLSGPNGAIGHLCKLFHEATGRTVSSNARTEVKFLLEAKAASEDAEVVPIRVAGPSGFNGTDGYTVAVDIGDEAGRAIIINSKRWWIEERSPVTFFRTNCTEPMVEPARPGKGSTDKMRKLFNLDDPTWDFLVNWQVTCFIASIPHVMPVFEGNPGTAKTTTTRFLVRIIDPSKGALNGPPHDSKSLAVAAGGSWAFALENISIIKPDISDDLSRMITGAGSRERTLYTNNDIFVRELQRVVIMNGISPVGMKPDLVDRSVTIPVPVIRSHSRMTDEEVEAAFEEAAPEHLAYLLDTLVKVLKIAKSGNYELSDYGRMASFERWLHFCDVARGTETLPWYSRRRKADAVATAVDDILVVAVRNYLEKKDGLTANLPAVMWLANLDEPEGTQQKRQWPHSTKAFTQRMRMFSAGLEQAGWELSESTRGGRTWWKITAPDVSKKPIPTGE